MLAVLVMTIGVLLLGYMIVVEDEPGAVPLLLIGAGAVWYGAARARARTHHE